MGDEELQRFDELVAQLCLHLHRKNKEIFVTVVQEVHIPALPPIGTQNHRNNYVAQKHIQKRKLQLSPTKAENRHV